MSNLNSAIQASALPAVANPFGEILTVQEVADLLKMSRQQIYEQTRNRARVRQAIIPIPFVRINGNLRFLRSHIERWLRDLSEYEQKIKVQ